MDRLEEKTGWGRPRRLAGMLAVLATFALGAGTGAALHFSSPYFAGPVAGAAPPVVVVPVASAPDLPFASSLPDGSAAAGFPEAGAAVPDPAEPEGRSAGDSGPEDGGTGLLDLISGPAEAGEPGRTLIDVLEAAAATIKEIEADEAAARRRSALLALSLTRPFSDVPDDATGPSAGEGPGWPAADPEVAPPALPPPLPPPPPPQPFVETVAGGFGAGGLLDQLPGGFSAAVPADIRKTRFIETILPLVRRVNDEIREERRRVQEIAARVAAGMPVGYRDAAWLARLAERYRLPGTTSPEGIDFAALLERVDVVPPSLALAQAAEESGWGTSRLARVHNALFGQTLGRDGGPGGAARFRSFARLLDGTRAYVHNLNSHAAYEGLRARRAVQRRTGRFPDGLALAAGLQAYSERGSDYVSAVREIIRGNLLHRHDLVRPAAGAEGRPLLIPASR